MGEHLRDARRELGRGQQLRRDRLGEGERAECRRRGGDTAQRVRGAGSADARAKQIELLVELPDLLFERPGGRALMAQLHPERGVRRQGRNQRDG